MPTWNLEQTKLGGEASFGTSAPGTHSYSLTFDSPVAANSLILLIQVVTMTETGMDVNTPSDTVGGSYFSPWSIAASGTYAPFGGHYYCIVIWNGLTASAGPCTVTFPYSWPTSYHQFPPFISTIVMMEYSGFGTTINGIFDFGLVDYSRGGLPSLYTGTTTGTNLGSIAVTRDVIVLGYAVNSGTAELDYTTFVESGLGNYSYTSDGVGSSIYAGTDLLPYFADIIVLTDIPSEIVPPPLGKKTKSMWYTIG